MMLSLGCICCCERAAVSVFPVACWDSEFSPLALLVERADALGAVRLVALQLVEAVPAGLGLRVLQHNTRSDLHLCSFQFKCRCSAATVETTKLF